MTKRTALTPTRVVFVDPPLTLDDLSGTLCAAVLIAEGASYMSAWEQRNEAIRIFFSSKPKPPSKMALTAHAIARAGTVASNVARVGYTRQAQGVDFYPTLGEITELIERAGAVVDAVLSTPGCSYAKSIDMGVATTLLRQATTTAENLADAVKNNIDPFPRY